MAVHLPFNNDRWDACKDNELVLNKETSITMPLFLQLSKKANAKKYRLDLNTYRNWHHIASNNVKIAYKDLAVLKLEDAPLLQANKVQIEYTLFRGDKRKFDLTNPRWRIDSLDCPIYCPGRLCLKVLTNQANRQI